MEHPALSTRQTKAPLLVLWLLSAEECPRGALSTQHSGVDMLRLRTLSCASYGPTSGPTSGHQRALVPYISIYICVRGPGALGRVGTQAGPSSKPLFTTLSRLWRMGHLPRGGRGAGLGSQSSQRGVLGCQSHPKVVQIWTISCFPIRISQNSGLKFLS